MENVIAGFVDAGVFAGGEAGMQHARNPFLQIGWSHVDRVVQVICGALHGVDIRILKQAWITGQQGKAPHIAIVSGGVVGGVFHQVVNVAASIFVDFKRVSVPA